MYMYYQYIVHCGVPFCDSSRPPIDDPARARDVAALVLAHGELSLHAAEKVR